MSVENKVPAIRFKGFGGEWETRGMLDCSSKIGDGLHGTPKYTADSGIYFINGNNLISGSIFITDETKQVNREEQSKSDQALGFNTILISINGTIGNLAWYRGEKVMLGKSVAYISLENCDHSYIYFYLQTKRVNGYFFNNLTGSTIKNLGLKTIRETAVLIPENELEQTKIGNYFQHLDTLIAQHQQKHDKLLNLKKALLEKMFPKQGATVPEIRFRGFSGEWKEKKLGKIAKITTGSSNRQDSGLDGEYTFFDRSEDIRTSNIYLFDCEAIIVAGEGSDFVPKYFVGKFDLHQRTYAIMNFDDGDSKFLFYYIHLFRKHFLDQAVGSTVKSLRLPMFQVMPIRHPKKIEQTKIGNLFNQLDTLITQHQAQLKKLNNIKQACLEKMFV